MNYLGKPGGGRIADGLSQAISADSELVVVPSDELKSMESRPALVPEIRELIHRLWATSDFAMDVRWSLNIRFDFMLRTQMIGLLFTLAGSGCALMAPTGRQSTPAGMVPGQDAIGQDFDLLHNCRFDPDAPQMSREDFQSGQEVQVITIDRRVRRTWGTEDVSLTMTLYTGTVESVDGDSIVLKDVIRMIESRAETGVPILQSVPYVSRMFRNSGVGRTSIRLPDNVTIPLKNIGGAFELSPSGIEKLQRLRSGDSDQQTEDMTAPPG